MLQREIKIFLIVGGSTVLVDYVVYLALLHGLNTMHILAKAVGFVVGTIFAYFANSLWTFRSDRTQRNMIAFIILYAGTLLLNVVVNSAVLRIGGTGMIAVQLAFLIATAVSAASNFLGMKFLVFKRAEGSIQ